MNKNSGIGVAVYRMNACQVEDTVIQGKINIAVY